jgi:hypothetical protein
VSVPVDARAYHLPEADAVIKGPAPQPHKTELDLFSEEETRRDKIIVAGCDPPAGILARMVERTSGVEIVHAPASSQLALDWLKQGKVHIAGSHLQDSDGGDFNLPLIRRQFSGDDMAVITFARWDEGLVVARGNPKGIRRVEDLARKSVSFINREPGQVSGRWRSSGGWPSLWASRLPAPSPGLT